MKPGLLILFALFCNASAAKTLHKEQSLYRNIIVTEVNNKRCMKFSLRRDRNQNQSCQYTDKPDVLVFDYAKLAVAGFLASHQPKSILIIGLGGGSLVQAFHSLAPEASITSVEIDDKVIKIAKKYFNLPTESWHKIVEKDGRIFVKREKLKGNSYDLVILDAFNGDYIPEHLMTLEFMKEVKAVLKDKGIVIANTFSTSILKEFESATYYAAFGNFYQFQGKYSGNRIVVASNHPLPEEKILKKRSEIYRSEFKKMDVELEYLWDSLDINPKIDKPAKILTDDYAPVNILKND